MTTDDDQKVPEQDSWNDVGQGGANAEDEMAESFAFSFDAVEEEPSPPSDPESARDIPLVVFPPPDDEVVSANAIGDGEQPGDGEQSDVIPIAAATDGPSANGEADEVFADEAVANHDRIKEQTVGEADDTSLSNEQGLADLGLLDDEDDRGAADAAVASGYLDDSADFGEPSHDAVSEDVSFDVGIVGGETLRAEGNQVDLWSDAEASGQGDPASIPLSAAVAAGAVAGPQPVTARNKRRGLGTIIGVGLGGLAALPITYAVMIWGFHQDPLKLGKQLPGQLASLLPQKLQPGGKPPAIPAGTPAPSSGPTAVSATEDLSTGGEEAAPTADQSAATAATAAAEPAEVEPVEPAETVAAPAEPVAEPAETVAEPAETVAEPAETVAAPAAPVAAPAETVAAPVAAPDPAVAATDTLEPAAAPVTAAAEPVMLEPEPVSPPVPEPETLAAVDTATVEAPIADATSPTTLPPSDPLAGIDALVADVAPPAPAVAAPIVPQLDETGVELAVERATHAIEALTAISDPVDPERNRMLVEWYKSLANLGEQLVTLETKAADSGHPSWNAPAAAADLLGTIAISEKAVADLDRLGRMWITSEKRRDDGISLVATLVGARQVGPYWSTRVVVAGGNLDGTDRSISIISRLAPPGDAGERVVVSGVMFDGNAVWAADMRPIPPTFEAPENAAVPDAQAPAP